MAVRSLMGVETEYAITGIASNGIVADRSRLIESLIAAARTSCRHLRDGSSGLFLTNGARLYVDRGYHPEFATPECHDPWEAVRYVRAGEALLLDLARQVKERNPQLREFSVFRSNVDYDRSGTTWGCHESYLHRSSTMELPSQLIPHFVTRIIYAGAGGFNPMGPGAEFTLSPRAWLLPNVTAVDSTGDRGIFHIRDEPLAGAGWNRMHVICGESLCSDTAAVLKIGTTALILAAVEAGRRPGTAVQLQYPVPAIRTVASDPESRKGIQIQGGGQLSAIEIQRHYLAEVEACPPDRLPAWAGELCALWRAQLDRLDARDPALERTLDWAIKRSLYRRWVSGRMPWSTMQRAGRLLELMERISARLEVGAINIAAALSGDASAESQLSPLEPLLNAQGLDWDDMRLFLRLRDELYEADVRFGQLGEKGIFEQLDRAGVLDHRLDRRAPASDARVEPPAGRAGVRGTWVQKLWQEGQAQQYRSDWTMVWHEATGRSLDLHDPFVSSAQWK